jgi:hypothetical protein
MFEFLSYLWSKASALLAVRKGGISFEDAAELLADCKIYVDVYGPPRAHRWYLWIDERENCIADGSFFEKEGYKIRVMGHEFRGQEAERLTTYFSIAPAPYR